MTLLPKTQRFYGAAVPGGHSADDTHSYRCTVYITMRKVLWGRRC